MSANPNTEGKSNVATKAIPDAGTTNVVNWQGDCLNFMDKLEDRFQEVEGLTAHIESQASGPQSRQLLTLVQEIRGDIGRQRAYFAGATMPGAGPGP